MAPNNNAFLSAAEACAGKKLSGATVKPQSGDSSAATAIVTADQWQGFIKLVPHHFAPQLAAEQSGIEAIASASAVRIPEVLGNGYNQDENLSWLAMERLDLHPLNDQCAATLGEELAQLHTPVDKPYGWHCDGFIGDNEQPNDEADDWVEFFRDQRLGFQLHLAASQGFEHLTECGYELLENLPLLFSGYSPTPCLIHGDLWPGNAAQLADGTPVIYDPAAYYGDHEAELGMCELFGGFPPEFWAAYQAIKPLDEGYAVRRYLYRLYHLLNHLTLFGAGYEAKAAALINRLNNEVR